MSRVCDLQTEIEQMELYITALRDRVAELHRLIFEAGMGGGK
jgi:hypothetical protein